MNESTRSLLVGILVLARRPLTATQLIALGRPLRLSATNIKSHLTRLTAEGVLSRTGWRRSQRYWLSPERQRLAERIAASLAEQPAQKWTGEWVIVAASPPADRTTRERLRAELWLDGFRPCARGTWLRPAWPMPWAIERAQVLAPTALCFVGKLVGTTRVEQVQKMYGLDSLDRQARRVIDQIQAELRSAGDPATAFRARLQVGALAARLAAHDPTQPPEIWERRRGLHELRQAFRSFDERIGRLADRFVDGVIGLERHRVNRRLLPLSVPSARELLRDQIQPAADRRIRRRP